jgi:hypothetical protein
MTRKTTTPSLALSSPALTHRLKRQICLIKVSLARPLPCLLPPRTRSRAAIKTYKVQFFIVVVAEATSEVIEEPEPALGGRMKEEGAKEREEEEVKELYDY